MSEKGFIRKAQKLTARMMRLNVDLRCMLRRNLDSKPIFEVLHFDKRYEYGNKSFCVYDFNHERTFKLLNEFVADYEKGNSPLLENDF